MIPSPQPKGAWNREGRVSDEEHEREQEDKIVNIGKTQVRGKCCKEVAGAEV